MNRQRTLAVFLLFMAFLALVASRAFPFSDDLSGVAEAAIAIAGTACALAGVWLWSLPVGWRRVQPSKRRGS